MRSATRLLVVTFTGIIVALLPVHAFAAPHQADREYGIVAHQPPPTTEPTPPPSGAPTADVIKSDAEEAEERAEQRRKLIMGITSAVLLGAVIWGRSVRRKKAKAKG